MYEDSSCYGPNNSMEEGAIDDGFCSVLPFMAGNFEEVSNHYQEEESVVSAEEIQLQHHHLMQQYPTNHHYQMLSNNWYPSMIDQVHEIQQVLDQNGNFNAAAATPPFSLAPDLLSLLNLTNSSSVCFTDHLGSFTGDLDSTSGLFDSNPLPPPPLLFGDGEGGDCGGLGYQDGDHGAEFTEEMSCIGRGVKKTGRYTKFTERQRREHLNEKFTALRNLVPNLSKGDRASVIGAAIEYIKELLHTVKELKSILDKKRFNMERIKRLKTEEGGGVVEPDHSTQSSWLKMKSNKDTEVDVRLVGDEVTIKLAQRKKMNCLLSVSRVFDELRLDLHHAAGGLIGDFYSFMFIAKVGEGSCVYASAIATKLIEAVDREIISSKAPAGDSCGWCGS